ncbi:MULTISPECIES: DUF1176 domain-containing protein [Acinetobacter]|uniref:DUF1176 domain-containing protein n=1 Tax=Acinetobacter TaxID=469 RepID=UPI0005C7748E|nr:MULTISPECIES: DUF1176 domain-containing protein [Acinetobacter]
MQKMLLACYLAVLSSSAFAQDIKGLAFYHEDWEIYCSNTGTCRAAGYYQVYSDDEPASLLLTRQAGARQPVQVEFALSRFQEVSMPAEKLKNIHFYVNGKDLGQVVLEEGTDFPVMGKLSANQAKALSQQPKKTTKIVFKNTNLQWQISDTGMAAVLLKMDDFQKRIGTVGALIQKGKADESNVLAAQPKLIVKHIKTSSKPYLTLRPSDKRYAALYQNLMENQPVPKKEEFCRGAYNGKQTAPQAIDLYKLTNKKVLAATLCWQGAYNEGYGAWVLDESLANQATFVTEHSTDFHAGILSSAQKGRGFGDCWSSDEWVWDGQQFVHTKDRWTGMCRSLAAGGIWDLDQIEAVVK